MASSKSYVVRSGLDNVGDITEARIEARLSVNDVIELCDISERTWLRWLASGAPRWAVRLVMSQRITLDHLGWKDWEIDHGLLKFKQLGYRYYWTPAKLIIPLYDIQESHVAWASTAENVSSLELARETKKLNPIPKSRIRIQALVAASE